MSNDPHDLPPKYASIPLPPDDSRKSILKEKMNELGIPLSSSAVPSSIPESAFESDPNGTSRGGALLKRGPGNFHNRHPFLFFASITLVVLIAVGAIGGVIYLAPYHQKASEFDLDRVAALEVGSLVLDRQGREIGRISMQDRRLVRLEQLPQHLIDALIATEDSRFFEHNGFDLRGITRAAIQNLKAGGVSQGGSTITQQLARHAFALGGRTVERKLTEVFLANRIEHAYTKREILESYFNRIYLGSGFWGIGSAARGYFGKNVEDLTIGESATICALIKSPSRFSPFRHPDASIQARNRTLIRMNELNMISDAKLAELSTDPNPALQEEDRQDRPHFLLAQIRKEALDHLTDHQLLDGLIIKTSVDLDLQENSIALIDQSLRLIESREGYKHPVPWSDMNASARIDSPKSSPYLQAALLVIENDTGRIITAVGGRNFRQSQFNRSWQANRQTGSAFLPFLYAAAYEYGEVSPVSTLVDAPFDNRRIMIGGESGVLGEWATESEEDSFEGNISAAWALTKSKNSPSARMALEHMSTDRVAGFARNLGLDGNYPDYPSIYLGTVPANLLDVVRAYSAFPNGGEQPTSLSLIASIENRNGTKFYKAPETTRQRVFSEKTAAQIHKSLTATFTEGTGKVWRPEVERLAGAVAGKSGTSYKFEDNWFIGYNSEYTWGVWIGFDTPQTIYPEAFGSDTALPIWLEMAKNLESKRPYPFTAGGYPTHQVCLKNGCKANEGCPTVDMPFSQKRWETFRADVPLCSEHTIQNFRMTRNANAGQNDDAQIRARPLNTPIVPSIRPVVGEDPYQSLNPKQIVKIE